jgi:hypothetical protein
MAAEQRKRFAARYKGAPVIEPKLTLDGHGAKDVVKYHNKGSLGWNQVGVQFESWGYQE